MATRERASDRGARTGAEAAARFRRELREARAAAGLSQQTVAAAVGISRSEWSRIEGGAIAPRDWILAGRMAAVVGLELYARLYAGADAVRDAGQVRLLGRLVRDLGDGWEWRHEVVLPGFREQRAWDAVGSHRVTGLRIKVEAETRLADCQATLRRWNRKRADDPGGRFVLLVADTRGNRAAIAGVAGLLRSELPCTGSVALASLRAGVDPAGDVLLVL